jgi:hypothetical protein
MADIHVLCDLFYWSDTDHFFIDTRKNKERMANLLGVAPVSFNIYFPEDLVPCNGDIALKKKPRRSRAF